MTDRKEYFRKYRQEYRKRNNDTEDKPTKCKQTDVERQKKRRLKTKLNSEITEPKVKRTNAERKKEYYNNNKRKFIDKQKEYYHNKKLKLAVNDLGSEYNETTLNQFNYTFADKEFHHRFKNNPFGHACDVCHRLWFQKDVKSINQDENTITWLEKHFPNENVRSFLACVTCKQSLDQYKMPTFSRSNGFIYPEYPTDLPPLNLISERLVSPRLPFMQIRRLRWHGGNYGIIGQVINVPVDVNNMVTQLPRDCDDDFTINVHIKRHLIHKSSYLNGFVKKDEIRKWLTYLVNTPLYRQYDIKIDHSFFKENQVKDMPEEAIELMTEHNDQDNEFLTAQQQTVLWNEDKYLCIAPGHKQTPLNVIYDEHAEELSFPCIYLGQPRKFNPEMKVTPFMISTSEIRRKDRRGVTPQHILYMAMKILRLRLSEGLFATFKCTGDTSQITKKMIEDKEFLEQCIERNLSFLKSIPNSVQYWASRKKDVFAMIRQLGKPTMFLTLSSSEIKWPDLLKILYKLNHQNDELTEETLERISSYDKSTWVNEDPVTCVIYFNKLVDVIMNILKSNSSSPFGKYRVVDYFKRIEFQHRGSAHAHILLWLANDPKEEISEDMPNTVNLINYLCSVQNTSYVEPEYSSQEHRHTFTCYKKNNKNCRFGMPYWPMTETCILIPMSSDDGRRKVLNQKCKILKEDLETKQYDSLTQFLEEHDINHMEDYLNIIRSGLHRPSVLMKRSMNEIWTNSFNPWILRKLCSNMDLQFILEEYSCAAYVVEYVNKTNRGISNLHKELIKMQEEYPDQDYTSMLKKLGLQVLDSVEMCSQEAAWYLLRQPMSESSRKIDYIPTTWPHEREKVRKTKEEMDEEELNDDSLNIWKDNVIQKYEKRPQDTMACVWLAQFVANYYKASNKKGYKIRAIPKIIRYRNYHMDDIINFKREMVTLYWPFSNEEVDILDSNKFLTIYDENEHILLERRKEFESNIDIESIMEKCRELCIEENENEDATEQMEKYIKSKEVDDDFLRMKVNNDDIIRAQMESMSAVIRKRENVMSSEAYCQLMRKTNKEQREIVLEAIYRMSDRDNTEPLQIFFTGPAGCGKTFTLKLLMESYNRFSQYYSSIYNAYVSCASTGKAAVAIGGSTVHSAFKISISKAQSNLSVETLYSYRHGFRNVCAVFVDEVSMIGAELLQTLNSRLQQITSEFDKPFGGLDIVFCGDLRQLPPVMATPIYRRMKNSLSGGVLWHSLKYFPLTKVMRQSDEQFSSILTKIGNGEKLSETETKVIESRFVDEKEVMQLCPSAVRLFLKNQSVYNYNRKALDNESTIEQVSLDIYSGYKNNEQLASMRCKLHKMKVSETGGLPYMINLLLEKPYMITVNIDVTDGLVNGAIGTLKHIEYYENPDSRVKRLWFDFNNSRTGRLIKMKCLGYVQANKDKIKSNWVPITERSATISFKSPALNCKRTQFPIVEASALTIHKSQGSTFDEVVYDYEASHEQQLVYVALSRVTSLSGLYITNPKGNSKFCHSRGGNNTELRNEFLRLENHKLNTITQECEQFIEKAQPGDLSLLTLNVQSLHAHKKDIETDVILNKSKIMALSETWLNNDEKIDLKGYRCITQFKRDNVKAGGVALYEKEDSLTCSTPHILLQFNKEHLKIDRSMAVSEQCGDVCAIESTVNGQRVLLVTLYLSPNSKIKDIEFFLLTNLLMYTPKASEAFEIIRERGYDTIPIILCGDFNLNLKDSKNADFTKFMYDTFGLELKSNPAIATTRGGSCIDMVFARHTNKIDTRNYISYFSYHRPLLSITTNSES